MTHGYCQVPNLSPGWGQMHEMFKPYTNLLLRKFCQLSTFRHQRDSTQQPQDNQTKTLVHCTAKPFVCYTLVVESMCYWLLSAFYFSYTRNKPVSNIIIQNSSKSFNKSLSKKPIYINSTTVCCQWICMMFYSLLTIVLNFVHGIETRLNFK